MVALVLVTALVGCASPAAPFRPGLTTLETSATSPAVSRSRFVSGAAEASGAALARTRPRRADPAGFGLDPASVIRHASAIASYGPRPGGSAAERQAADYVAARLAELGYEPRRQEFALPNGATSVNIIAVAPGENDDRVLLLGAHLDSKPPSPGANDNASGCGLLLEMARVLADSPPPVSVELVFWGCEEFLPVGTDSHHLGSRHHAASLTAAERNRVVGAISVDMVGVGSRFHVRTMERGPQSLREMLLRDARADGVGLSFLKDRGRTGWSDHEPYELRGVPAVWLQWQDDPNYHTVRDTGDKLQPRTIRTTGEFLLGFTYGLDGARMRRLDAGR